MVAARMKAVVVSKERGPWELQERERPQVGPGQVLVHQRAASGAVRFKAVVTY